MEVDTGGVSILFAPNGVGKTSYLAHEAEVTRKAGGHVVVLPCVQNKQYLYDLLGITQHHYLLSEILPKGSVIIMDQMESAIFSEDLKSLVRQIALDSRKHKNFKVIICVSEKSTAKHFCDLNGGEKITMLGTPRYFMWNTEKCKNFIDTSSTFKDWDQHSKDELLKMAVRAGAPGFLFEVATDPETNSSNFKKHHNIAEKYYQKWLECEDEVVVKIN